MSSCKIWATPHSLGSQWKYDDVLPCTTEAGVKVNIGKKINKTFQKFACTLLDGYVQHHFTSIAKLSEFSLCKVNFVLRLFGEILSLVSSIART